MTTSAPAGGEHPVQLAQRRAVVLEVLDHVEAHDEVEGVLGEGHLQHRALHHLAHVAPPGGLGGGGGELHAGDGAPAREVHHVAPGTAPRVEDARARLQAETLDCPGEHPAAPAVPPVAVLHPVGLQLEVVVHRTHLS